MIIGDLVGGPNLAIQLDLFDFRLGSRECDDHANSSMRCEFAHHDWAGWIVESSFPCAILSSSHFIAIRARRSRNRGLAANHGIRISDTDSIHE